MNTVQAREAKARLSQLLDAAERGEETVITRHGKPVARIVPPASPPSTERRRVNNPGSPYDGMSLGELLLAIPGPIDVERDQTPMRQPDL